MEKCKKKRHMLNKEPSSDRPLLLRGPRLKALFPEFRRLSKKKPRESLRVMEMRKILHLMNQHLKMKMLLYTRKMTT